ncbi:nuclear transport factor 2 family protein [Salipiger abyssi]|uniref:nuclear transport factor 2 family protein n=1 Tax=Salipiger abyssi TaxID=1250539 RepID=UPI0040592A78
MASFYAFGLLRDRTDATQGLLFGATVVLRLARVATGWQIAHIRLSSAWMRGADRLAAHWLLPSSDAGWQVGDPPPVLVSEIDSPWALQPIGPPPGDLHAAISELYSRYSFAIDQGDIGLLISAYTPDIAGGFAPMGQFAGRHAVIGQLRSFRRHWPWMQHFADLVRVEAEPDGRHARAIVGRIVPEQPVGPDGRKLYGAHYQLRARLEDDGQWRFCWTDYRPGWFDAETVPAFDIGNSTA